MKEGQAMGTVKKGKRAELLMMAMLIKNEFNVFEELADEEGIDCRVLARNNAFFPIQIKSRADFIGGDLVSVHNFCYNNMLVIIYDEKSEDYWIIPADEYRNLSIIHKDKDGTEYYRLTVKKRKPLLLENYKKEKGIQVLRRRVNSKP